MGRIKYTELSEYRQEMLHHQSFVCPLCQRAIEPGEAVLDHDHMSGHVRGVLHRNCNATEGRIGYRLKRVKMCDKETFLINLMEYWATDYSHNPIHPKHKK